MSIGATRHLVETAVDLVVDQIQSNIAEALADIRVNRADNAVTLEPPRDYFIYPRAKGYRTPAVFVIGDRIDFLKERRGANHINAAIRLNVTVLVEDKDAERITRKAYRYQAALHQVLDQVRLQSSDNQASLTVVIQSASYSPLYSNLEAGDPQAVYRKEISLELDVFQFEPL
jgi:uncharacterized membrane-anchored protein YhcB (DUF1043 family)